MTKDELIKLLKDKIYIFDRLDTDGLIDFINDNNKFKIPADSEIDLIKETITEKMNMVIFLQDENWIIVDYGE